MKKTLIALATSITLFSCTKDELVTPSQLTNVDTLDWKLTMKATEFGINIDNMSPTETRRMTRCINYQNVQYGTQYVYETELVTVSVCYYWDDGHVWIIGVVDGHSFDMYRPGLLNICNTAYDVPVSYKLVDYKGEVRSAYWTI